MSSISAVSGFTNVSRNVIGNSFNPSKRKNNIPEIKFEKDGSRITIIYDNQGKITKKIKHDAKENLTSSISYKYNEQGEQSSSTETIYEYNNRGEYTGSKKIEYTFGTATRPRQNKPEKITIPHTINEFNEQGKQTSSTEATYKNGQISEVNKHYNGNDLPLYSYDAETKKLPRDKQNKVVINLLTNADGELLSDSDKQQLRHFSDNQWKNIEQNEIMQLKNANGEAFNGQDIYWLSNIKPKEWENIKQFGILESKNANGKALSGRDIYWLSSIKAKGWENFQKRDLTKYVSPNGRPLDASKIAKLANMDDRAFAIYVQKSRFRKVETA